MKRMCWFLALFLLLAFPALAENTFKIELATDWLLNLADYLTTQEVLNVPGETGDLSRPGEYLLQYDFGTVIISGDTVPKRGNIVEVFMTTGKIADCMGNAVGMSFSDVATFSGFDAIYPLSFVSMQDEGVGWCWLYTKDQTVYGAEWISYLLGDDSATEIQMTYTVEENIISSIRVRMDSLPASEALSNLESAGEIAMAQQSDALIRPNQQSAFAAADATINGNRYLNEQVYTFVAEMGEPDTIQSLPSGGGRLLIYPEAIVSCNLDKATGEEKINSITVTSSDIEGPRSLKIGMLLADAVQRFRCDNIITTAGGTLYKDDTFIDHVAQLVVFNENEMILSYQCTDTENSILLEITIQNGQVCAWQLTEK